MAKTLLPGFGFTGYRSFYGPMSYVGPLSPVNVLAGRNNAGKSNVLRFLQDLLPSLVRGAPDATPSMPSIAGLDLPQDVNRPEPFGYMLATGIAEATDRVGSLDSGQARQLFTRLVGLPALHHPLCPDDLVWIRLTTMGNPGTDRRLDVDPHQVEAAIKQWNDQLPDWQRYSQQFLTHPLSGGNTDPRDVMRRLILRCLPTGQLPPVATVVASRRIEAGTANQARFSGMGLIDELAVLQNPSASTWRSSRERFDAINRFARTVLEDPDAQLHIPHDRTTVLVETAGRTLPLENLGTGIQQVIIIAAAATTLTDHIVCVEEPETHLHPDFQRKLATYLASETSNQYMLATHSPHLLDYEEAAVFHLALGESGSALTGVKKPHELTALCSDLGARPSDLLQSNAVLWVEGPADRIYVRHWLYLADPTIEEGLDYAVMFYGGKLLNHLTVDDEALADFINLRELNRHSAVLIDSDKTTPRARLGRTKQRIREEFEGSASGFAWVTAGYTIENYVPRSLLASAVARVHAGRALTGNDERWDNPLWSAAGKPKFDKIAIAREVVQDLSADDLDRWDLKQQVKRLAGFVRDANGSD